MFGYKLVRESDLQEWNTLARSDDAAVHALAKEADIEAFICEGPAEYHLERREQRGTFEEPTIIPVTAGKPRYVATIQKVVDGFTITILRLVSADAVDRLTDEPVKTEEEADQVLQATMRQHGIGPQEIKIQHR